MRWRAHSWWGWRGCGRFRGRWNWCRALRWGWGRGWGRSRGGGRRRCIGNSWRYNYCGDHCVSRTCVAVADKGGAVWPDGATYARVEPELPPHHETARKCPPVCEFVRGGLGEAEYGSGRRAVRGRCEFNERVARAISVLGWQHGAIVTTAVGGRKVGGECGRGIGGSHHWCGSWGHYRCRGISYRVGRWVGRSACGVGRCICRCCAGNEDWCSGSGGSGVAGAGAA